MSTPIGQTALTGIKAGAFVAVSPPALVVLATGGNLFGNIIAGLMLRAATNGQYDSAFNVLMTSPGLWKALKYSASIGCAISAISFIGFCVAEGRAPTWGEIQGKKEQEAY